MDLEYQRGWDDALEVVVKNLKDAKDLAEAKNKLSKLQDTIKEGKFQKLRYILGVFDGTI
jgi:hypothetical protein